ncbi:MAG: intermembrane transport protein PqiB, partial [Acetobacteraceae bacterium]
QYDPARGTLQERVLLALEPARIALPGAAEWPPHGGRAAMDALMNRLIEQGLRAETGSSIPLVGSPNVQLAFVQPPSAQALAPGDPPTIPSARGGTGIDSIMKAVSAVSSKIENLPLDQIADNLKTVTGRAAALSKSDELTQSLGDLHSAIANLKTVSASAKANVPAVLAALQQVARQADRTVASAHQLISSAAGTGPTGLNTASLGQTLYQINRAAQAVRQLADYLDRHPSALIRGRR